MTPSNRRADDDLIARRRLGGERIAVIAEDLGLDASNVYRL